MILWGVPCGVARGVPWCLGNSFDFLISLMSLTGYLKCHLPVTDHFRRGILLIPADSRNRILSLTERAPIRCLFACISVMNFGLPFASQICLRMHMNDDSDAPSRWNDFPTPKHACKPVADDDDVAFIPNGMSFICTDNFSRESTVLRSIQYFESVPCVFFFSTLHMT